MADQPFRLLAILLDRRGEVVTRQELEQELWPGQAELDRADNLNTAIKKVRVALDDEAERPRFIETLPRRGYSFIGHVESCGGNGNGSGNGGGTVQERGYAPLHGELAIVPDAGQLANNRAGIVLASWKRNATACFAIAGVAFGVWWFTPLPRPRVRRIDQITYSSRIDTPVKPVSNRENVYYIQRAGDHWDLMKTRAGGGDGVRLDVPGKSAMVLDVSPDHTKLLVATFEKRDGNDELWIMPARGGAATHLGVIASGAAFSPDGKKIAYASGNSLFMMDADGLHRSNLATLFGAVSWLAWSPNGRSLRFTVNSPSKNTGGDIWEISADGKNLHPVSLQPVDPYSVCCGSWTQGGRYYVFSSNQGGSQWNIWAIREHRSWRRDPWGAVQITFGPNSALSGAAAGDGKHLFYYSGIWRQEMQRFDLRSREFVPVSGGENQFMASYSRDGRWIAYIGAQTGALVRSRADGSDRLALTPSNVIPQFPRWSPDGKWIVFTSAKPSERGGVYTVAAAGGPLERLSVGREVGDPDWSSDGRSLVVSRAARNDGDRELVIINVGTKQAHTLAGSNHLTMSRWSPDGRYISATSDDQTQLKLFNVSSKSWHVIAHGEALGISVWSPDARYLYFQDLLGPGEQLHRYDVKSHTVQTVVDFSDFLKSGVSRCALVAAAPDGSPLVEFNRSGYDLFSAEVTLP
jgi:Tol biopolymer transport system component/DNA-binding winged helix-turn-helix (wHTH) protein